MELLLNPLMPLFAVLLFQVLRKQQSSKKFLVAVFLYIYFCAIPATGIQLMQLWAPDDRFNQGKYDAALVLGGVSDHNWYEQRQYKPLLTNYHRFNHNVDRVVKATEFLLQGKVEKVLLADDLNCRPFNEAELVRDFMLQQGVALERIEVFGGVLNTAVEAEKAKAFLLGKGYDKVLLITTQSHMRRASAAFRKQGLDIDFVSVNKTREKLSLEDFIPRSNGFLRLEVLSYEIAGYISYWFKGLV